MIAPRDLMHKRDWHALGLVILFLSYCVIAPVHTVHHGLDNEDSPDCPIFAIADQTSGKLPDDIAVTFLLLPLSRRTAIPDHIPLGRSLYKVSRSRAPPPSLPS